MLLYVWESRKQILVLNKAIRFLKNRFYLWPSWVFVAARGLSLVAENGGYSLLCVGFSWWLLSLRSTGSRHAGFSSCGAQA